LPGNSSKAFARLMKLHIQPVHQVCFSETFPKMLGSGYGVCGAPLRIMLRPKFKIGMYRPDDVLQFALPVQ
jgi:hypothetical protein